MYEEPDRLCMTLSLAIAPSSADDAGSVKAAADFAQYMESRYSDDFKAKLPPVRGGDSPIALYSSAAVVEDAMAEKGYTVDPDERVFGVTCLCPIS